MRALAVLALLCCCGCDWFGSPAPVYIVVTATPATPPPTATPIVASGTMNTPVAGNVWAITVEKAQLLTQLDEPLSLTSAISPLRPQGRWLEVWTSVRNQTDQSQKIESAAWVVTETTGAQYPAYDPGYDYMVYDDYIHGLAHYPLGLVVLPRTTVAIIADFDVPVDLPTHNPTLLILTQARVVLNPIVIPTPSPALPSP